MSCHLWRSFDDNGPPAVCVFHLLPGGRGDGGPFDDGVSECFGVFDLVSKLGRVDFCTSQQRLFLNNNADNNRQFL